MRDALSKKKKKRIHVHYLPWLGGLIYSLFSDGKLRLSYHKLLTRQLINAVGQDSNLGVVLFRAHTQTCQGGLQRPRVDCLSERASPPSLFICCKIEKYKKHFFNKKVVSVQKKNKV